MSHDPAVEHWRSRSVGDVRPPASPPMGQPRCPRGRRGLCALRARRKAADARFVLMGWADDDWRAASAQAEQDETTRMQGIPARQRVMPIRPAAGPDADDHEAGRPDAGTSLELGSAQGPREPRKPHS